MRQQAVTHFHLFYLEASHACLSSDLIVEITAVGGWSYQAVETLTAKRTIDGKGLLATHRVNKLGRARSAGDMIYPRTKLFGLSLDYSLIDCSLKSTE